MLSEENVIKSSESLSASIMQSAVSFTVLDRKCWDGLFWLLACQPSIFSGLGKGSPYTRETNNQLHAYVVQPLRLHMIDQFVPVEVLLLTDLRNQSLRKFGSNSTGL